MPTGASAVIDDSERFSATWMRRSTSRTWSRYSARRVASLPPRSRFRSLTSSVSESRMLLSRCIRRLRWSTVPGRPNRRSNTTRGLISIGTGVVADDHEMVFM